MKKIFYSVYTKIIVSILCVVSIVGVFSVGLDSFKQWNEYEYEIYMLEDQFEDSYYISNILDYTSYAIYDIAIQYLNNPTTDVQAYLTETMDADEKEYLLVVDGKRFTNKQEGSQESKYYYKVKIDSDGVMLFDTYPENDDVYMDISQVNGHTVEIYVGLKDNYIKYIQDVWTQQNKLVKDGFMNVTYWFLCAWLCIMYLLFTIGKDEEEVIKTHTIDRMFIEFNIFIGIGIFVCALLLFRVLISQYRYGDFPFDLLKFFVQCMVSIKTTILLILLCSIVRNIKNKTFISRSLLVRIVKYIITISKKFLIGCKNVINEMIELSSNQFHLFVIAVLFLYTAIIGFFGIRVWYEGIVWVLLGIVLFMTLGYFVLVYLQSLNKIKVGINKIKNGDLAYKIEMLRFKDLNTMKEGINDISKGLQVSVQKALKAERLKTELITNVSHDLKTPLTSIISYTQLLSQVEHLPEEAKDYISIIDKKSYQLKTLTQDLFDISKVQSGNENIVYEKLNVKTLLAQSLAEYETELENLTICTKMEEELYIYSDGRKMSRVINNLLGNIVKYTMLHTRVFIDAYSKNDKVIIEMKNISSYPLDFDKEEIMQRFKRGDESRSEEGHGLGLAIVKSYVEATSGKFDIVLDGDMFKTIIEYDSVQ